MRDTGSTVKEKGQFGGRIITTTHLIEVSEVVRNNVRQKTSHTVLHVEGKKDHKFDEKSEKRSQY